MSPALMAWGEGAKHVGDDHIDRWTQLAPWWGQTILCPPHMLSTNVKMEGPHSLLRLQSMERHTHIGQAEGAWGTIPSFLEDL